ncbi:MAG: tetratricopeptide repeat protein, partial [bacterium]
EVNRYLQKSKRRLEFDSSFLKAVWLAEAGEWNEAITRFESSLKFASEKKQEYLLESYIDSFNDLKEKMERKKRLNALYEEGKKHLNKKEWLQAISLFTKVIMEESLYLDVEELNKKAQVNYYLEESSKKIQARQWADARAILKNAEMTEPGNQEILKLKALLEKGVEKENVDFYFIQAREAINFRDYESAKKNLRKIIRLDPENRKAAVMLNELLRSRYEKRREQDKWESLLPRKLADISPGKLKKLAVALLVVLGLYILIAKIIRPGKVWSRLGRLRELDENRGIYEELLAADPGKREIYPALASIYKELEQEDKLNSLLEFCQGKTGQGDVYDQVRWSMCIADIHKELGDIQKAVEEYEAAYAQYPHLEEVLDRMLTFYEALAENAQIESARERLQELQLAKSNFSGQEEEKGLAVIEKTGFSTSTHSNKKVTEKENREALLECFGKDKRTDSSKKISSISDTDKSARKLLTDVLGEKSELADSDLIHKETGLSKAELDKIEAENKQMLKDFLGRK